MLFRSLASEIQKSFSSAKRVDRGVRQAGFLVLRKTSMPSVLVELGYISNREEERFMKSDAGQQKLAASVYNAFAKYKWEYDRKRGAVGEATASSPAYVNTSSVVEDADQEEFSTAAPAGSEAAIMQRRNNTRRESAGLPANVEAKAKSIASESAAKKENQSGQVIYKIQILTSEKKLPTNSKLFKGYKPVSFYQEKGIYKYTYGETSSFETIKKQRRQVAKDFKDAFIVAFKDGKKVKY